MARSLLWRHDPGYEPLVGGIPPENCKKLIEWFLQYAAEWGVLPKIEETTPPGMISSPLPDQLFPYCF
ncbi:MAG: hypothetical protein ACK2TU_10755, partial [Anaerolineales bacterium]